MGLNLNTNFNGPPLPILRDDVGYVAFQDFGVAASRTSSAWVASREGARVYALVAQGDGDFAMPQRDLFETLPRESIVNVQDALSGRDGGQGRRL